MCVCVRGGCLKRKGNHLGNSAVDEHTEISRVQKGVGVSQSVICQSRYSNVRFMNHSTCQKPRSSVVQNTRRADGS